MSHSLTRLWVHGVFSTKDRVPLIHPEFESKLYHHLKEKLEKDLSCRVRIINGMPEHVHVLFLLDKNYAIKDVFKSIKGESSNWWNQSDFTRRKFAWQTGYGVFSVSESKVKQVENYIRRQKEHHKKMTYTEEVELLMKKHGLSPE